MKFSEFVHHDAVTSSLSASDRDGVIAELVDSLVAADALSADHRDSVVSATIAREELGITNLRISLQYVCPSPGFTEKSSGDTPETVPGLNSVKLRCSR